MKKYTVTAFLAAALMGVSATLTGCKGNQIVDEKNTPVSVQKLGKKDLQDYISVAGAVQGSNIVHVTTEVEAKVASVNVELGSRVKVGDTLCTFETADLQKQYDDMLAAAQKGENLQKKVHDKNVRALNDAKSAKTAALAKAQKAVNRATDSLNQGKAALETLKGQRDAAGQAVEALAASDAMEQYNEAVRAYNDLFGQVAEAEREVSFLEDALAEAQEIYNQTMQSCNDAIEMAQEVLDNEEYGVGNDYQKMLDGLKKQLDNCVVKATCSGIITELNIAEGSFPAMQTMMTIEDTDTLRINVVIQETDILSVHEGQKAYIKANATGDEEYIGTVSHVVKIVGASSYREDAHSYTAEITLEKSDSNLLIGMNAKAKIILNEEKDVLAVPYDSIVTDDEKNLRFMLRSCRTERITKCAVYLLKQAWRVHILPPFHRMRSKKAISSSPRSTVWQRAISSKLLKVSTTPSAKMPVVPDVREESVTA